MKKKYPLFDIYWDNEDVQWVTDVIKRGSYWATGPEIKKFEVDLADFFKVKYVATFNSGTSALHAILLAYNITQGEVIVPSMCFISTANCVLLVGSKPIFAEIEDKTLGLDPEDVNNKITEKTRAIIPMHYGGMTCRHIKILKEIAEDNNLVLIEDNAESLGAEIEGKMAGTIGDAGMLSFCQNKIITTGEGGAICTNDEEIYKKLLLIRSHGRVEHPGSDYFSNIKESEYIQIGYNYRLPTMSAALGIAQLKKVNEIIKLRRKIGKYYDEKLSKNPNLEIFGELSGFKNVYQLYSVLLKDFNKKEELQDFLLKEGIFTKVYFYPIHLKSFYRETFGYKEGDLPITEKLSKRILTLPISLRFENEDQNYIIKKVAEFFK
ncbi:MAG: DegT/DnrJ/EryC1/StrS family aminotransferase [Candidatus Heimdallarchaeota archaeon]